MNWSDIWLYIVVIVAVVWTVGGLCGLGIALYRNRRR